VAQRVDRWTCSQQIRDGMTLNATMMIDVTSIKFGIQVVLDER